MVVELKEYDSAVEIAKGIEGEISRTKSVLGEYLRRLDEIRTLAERSKRFEKWSSSWLGKRLLRTRLER